MAPRDLHLRFTALALVLAGCAANRTLVAENGEHRMVANGQRSGITVVLTTEAWDGAPADLGQDITIVHLLVHNRGMSPVLLAPGDFEMRDENGFRCELLDPGASFRLQGSPESSYDIGRSTAFGTIASEGADVAQAALPWGVLEPGTQMRGFVYFQACTRTSNHPTLLWRPETPQHVALGEFRFPLHVSAQRL